MSTIYGTIHTDNNEVDVDASLLGERVALIIDNETYLRMRSAQQVRDFIRYLNMAVGHVWGETEMFDLG